MGDVVQPAAELARRREPVAALERVSGNAHEPSQDRVGEALARYVAAGVVSQARVERVQVRCQERDEAERVLPPAGATPFPDMLAAPLFIDNHHACIFQLILDNLGGRDEFLR